MVGAPPRRTQHVDMYPWLRAALRFAGVSVERHEALAEKAGPVAAAEVLLLIIAKKCKSNKRKWQEAKDQGIPWLQKRWSSLTILQEDYNGAVATALDDAVSDSAAPDLQPAPCAIRMLHSQAHRTETRQASAPWADSADIKGGGGMAGVQCPGVIEEGSYASVFCSSR